MRKELIERLLAFITNNNCIILSKPIALLFAAFFIGVSTLVYSQHSISVVLVDEENTPIPDGAVFLASQDTIILKSTYSDSLGVAGFDDVKAGNYLFRIRCLDYLDTIVTFELKGNIDDWKISLKLDETIIEGVDVVYKKPIIETRGNLIIVNVDKTILKGSGSAYDLLTKLPGMSSNAQGTLIFRGRPGINVRIDGRNLRMSGDDLTNYLYSLSSDDVEKVEILHTPDATEDAEGTSAIINIVTLKGKKLGFNGSLNGGLTYGKTFRGNLGVNLNYRPSVKLNIYGSYSVGPGNFITQFENDRDITSAGLSIEERINSDYGWLGHIGKVGLDYKINDKSSIGFSLGTNISDKETVSTSTISNLIGTVQDSIIAFDGTTDEKWREYSGSIFYNRTIDSMGSELEILGDFVRFETGTFANLKADYQYNWMHRDHRKQILRWDHVWRDAP